jgi:hypothetical protein
MADIHGLEAIRQNLDMTPAQFSEALVTAAGALVDKPLHDIELNELAVIYAACATVKETALSETGDAIRAWWDRVISRGGASIEPEAT